VFVTFEGLDGAGKSTQAGLAATFLAAGGHEVVTTREPGGTPLGEEIRRVLLDGPDLTAWAEASLFAAARAELAERVIRPALGRRAHVVSDRYLDSSLAYQGIARGLGVEQVLGLNAAVADLLPDRTFVLVLDEETAAARRGGTLDRIEREDGAFRVAVARGFRVVAERWPGRVRALDATLQIDELQHIVQADLAARA
jgi:dTMP kinase